MAKNPNLIGRVIICGVRLLVWLRYRLHVNGLKEIAQNGTEKILFLANHPALIDPPILFSILYPKFGPRALADEYQIDRPVLGPLARFLGIVTVPNLERSGIERADQKLEAVRQAAQWLRDGQNLLLYPAGHLKHSREEKIGATSATEFLLKEVPDVRIVIIRQNGLWGSSFSWGLEGRAPHMLKGLIRGAKYLLANLIFFIPRRPIEYDCFEPDDFPRDADKSTINRTLEDLYNREAWPNLYVPYLFWKKNQREERPDPKIQRIEGDVQQVSEGTRNQIFDKLRDMSGKQDIDESDDLGYDLGLDSLSKVELITWLEDEFGFSIGSPESLQTVSDVLLTAVGQGVSATEIDIKPVAKQWFKNRPSEALTIPEGSTIADVFLKTARANLSQPIFADQRMGVLTYRKVLRAIFALKPTIEQLEGDYIGIQLPASALAPILYLSVMFAGKTPVMVNWTTGIRNVQQSLDTLSIKHILTSRALYTMLKDKGIEIEKLKDSFVFIEDIKSSMKLKDRLTALLKSYVSIQSLRRDQYTDTAVVLFTSGSESIPKAVPLSHTNILRNIRDTLTMVTMQADDVMIGILPAFHSFGLTATMILPACLGLPVMYHPNPTESVHIAKLIDLYKGTLLIGIPAFLSGILRVANPDQLASLRLVVTGAEKCPESVYKKLEQEYPDVLVLEGYGVTECSPIISVNSEDNPMPQTIGSVLPSYEYVLVNPDTGKPVGKKERGILLVRGPCVFSGYLNVDKNPFVDYDGKQWYSTEDLVTESPEGILTFQGRLKRFIKLGGEMISLPAIESVLAPHFPAPEDQEGPAIAVEATPGDNPEIVLFTTIGIERSEANDVIRDAGLSALHNIRKVIRVDSIPLLGNGKIDYKVLKSQLSDQN